MLLKCFDFMVKVVSGLWANDSHSVDISLGNMLSDEEVCVDQARWILCWSGKVDVMLFRQGGCCVVQARWMLCCEHSITADWQGDYVVDRGTIGAWVLLL